MTTIVIARHGNTFLSSERPRRIGCRTDLPLVPTGQEQARALGQALLARRFIPDIIYTAPLLRSRHTAELVAREASPGLTPLLLDTLSELDHGADENQFEEDVQERLGSKALHLWDEAGIVPEGWTPAATTLKNDWRALIRQACTDFPEGTVLFVTSNGRARFVPLLEEVELAPDIAKNRLKLQTGAFGILECSATQQIITQWNIRP